MSVADMRKALQILSEWRFNKVYQMNSENDITKALYVAIQVLEEKIREESVDHELHG